MTITFNKLHQELQKQYYAELDFPISRSILEEAAQAFFTFLEEPDEVKKYIDFSISDKHRRGDVGYKHRHGNNRKYEDNKDFFHFHPALFERYKTFLDNHVVVKDFMLKALPIWQCAYDQIQAVLATLEERYPNLLNRVLNTDTPHVLVRFLRYDWQESGLYLAKPHFDCGSFTLAIAESDPGLRIGSCPEDLKPIKHHEQKAILMLSSNFRKLLDDPNLMAGWHDVVQLDEARIGKPYARWAIVAFVEGIELEALSREETHKHFNEDEII